MAKSVVDGDRDLRNALRRSISERNGEMRALHLWRLPNCVPLQLEGRYVEAVPSRAVALLLQHCSHGPTDAIFGCTREHAMCQKVTIDPYWHGPLSSQAASLAARRQRIREATS